MCLPKSQHEFIYQPFAFSSVADLVHIDFSNLSVFESVRWQYQHWGIQFEGAITLQPSNPAFGVDPGTLVLTPEAGRSSISVHFDQLRKTVGALVTATQQIKLTLFDRENHPIAEQFAGVNQYLRSVEGFHARFPRHQLELIAEGIARAEFSSESPFVLHSFFCG